MNRNYVIITPVRNEEKFLELTIRSVVEQTIPPLCWVLVDDGSSDSTPSIIAKAEATCKFIKGVYRKDRGYRLSGTGVVDAVNEGYKLSSQLGWNFLGKLDGDLSFDRDYFEKCLARFEDNPKLGIGGGAISRLENGVLVSESPKDPLFHVRGAVKIYRKECWDAIGGIVAGPCWDSIDELKANMLGWQTYTFSDLKVHHHRPAGEAFGRWKDSVKGGRGNYVTGYHPVFMFLKCLSRLSRAPRSSLGLLYGYISSYCARAPRLVDKSLMRYIRKQQLLYIVGRPSLWNGKGNRG